MTCLTTMTLLAATLAAPALAEPLPKTNGLYTAQIGAQCVTRPNAWAALSLWDFERAYQMVGQDSAAFTKMVEAKRVLYLKEDLMLFVTKRIETRIQVRPQGEIFELWMGAIKVDCDITSTETTEMAKPAKPTKTTRGAR